MSRVLLGERKGGFVIASTEKTTAIWRMEANTWHKLNTDERLAIWSSVLDRDGTLWALSLRDEPTVLQLQGETWTAVQLASEEDVRTALGNPPSEKKLKLVPRSFVPNPQGGLVSANIVDSVRDIWGVAILETGDPPKRHVADAGTSAQPDIGKDAVP